MNKTQCPHCATDFKISDEQLRLSQGKVRCGNCLERFDAHAELNKHEVAFDPRSAFMEPLSYYEEEHLSGVDDILPDSRSVEFKDTSMAPVEVGKLSNTNEEPENELIPDENKLELNEILKQHAKIEAEKKTVSNITETIDEPIRPSPNPNALNYLANNFDPELSVHLDDDDFTEELTDEDRLIDDSTRFLDPSTVIPSSSQRVTEASIQFDPGYVEEDSIQHIEPSLEVSSLDEIRIEPTLLQAEIELNNIELDFIQQSSETVTLEEEESFSNTQSSALDFADQDTSLENEIDVEETTSSISAPQLPNDINFDVAKKSKIWVWLLSPILILLILLLSISFIYQLWQKQLISWPDREDVRTTLAPVTKPLIHQLDELNVVLPERRSLSLLQLLSAKTEAHPTRSSTLLLRVSLINRAAIKQPLPWLELTLNNSSGKTISRRSLAPEDYIHNNRISTTINSNELKKITIELLSFPQHATGFEIRLLNK